MINIEQEAYKPLYISHFDEDQLQPETVGTVGEMEVSLYKK